MCEYWQCEFSNNTCYKPMLLYFLCFQIINNQGISAKPVIYRVYCRHAGSVIGAAILFVVVVGCLLVAGVSATNVLKGTT